MAVKQKCREPQVGDRDRLSFMLRTLQNVENRLQGDALVKHCEYIVRLLGTISVPQSLQEYVNFMSNIRELMEFFDRVCTTEELILITLKSLYNGISDETQQYPSPTMSIVLQLINVQMIPDAVNHILQSGYSDKKLEHSLKTLCKWLTTWTCTANLGPLVFYFMKGLESEHYYEILKEVILEYVKKLFILLILKDTRQYICPVVLYMLSNMQHTPEAFHKIIPDVPNVLKMLHVENSETSQMYIKQIVNLCMNLMAHFTNYPEYDELKRTLEIYNPTNAFEPILTYNSWSSGDNAAVSVRCTLQRVGLNNLGNTCYMNSVLQALFMTKLFRNDILQSKKDCVPLISKLQTLFVLLQHSQKTSLSPSEILNMARPPGFLQGHQHDSSEFMGYLLDILHEQERSIFTSSSTDVEAGAESYVTVVQKSFGGRTLTVSRCGNCGTQSERADHFRELQLSFPANNSNQSVETLLDYYFQPEKLCDDNQYHCDKCHGLTDSERITKIVEFPCRLVLTLKQFHYDPMSQLRTKLLQHVKLNTCINLENEEYELYAAVVHCGSSLDSGHYYTFARDDDDWFKFNDCVVIRTTHQELFNLKPPETPYILFYRKLNLLEPESLQKSALSIKLQGILNRDNAEVDHERKRKSIRVNNYRQDKNDDPPPPGCGGGGFNDSVSKLVF